VHSTNDNCRSSRDDIDQHDERASEFISEVTLTCPSNSVDGSSDGNALSTCSTAVGPESSVTHSSVSTTRSIHGSGNSGSRIFYTLNVDSHTTHSTSVISESILSPQSLAFYIEICESYY